MYKPNLVVKNGVMCCDVLDVIISIAETKITLVLVYFDVIDRERNQGIKYILEARLEEIENDERLILLGDFNGHLGFIVPQKLNWKGKITLENYTRN